MSAAFTSHCIYRLPFLSGKEVQTADKSTHVMAGIHHINILQVAARVDRSYVFTV